MRELFPTPGEIDLQEVYQGLTLQAGADRARVAIGMVSSLDGAASVGGTSGGLGGEADGQAFRRLRAAADAILVGAGTVRAEDYQSPRGTVARRQDRRIRGLEEKPQLVIVTRSLQLSVDHRVFADRDHPPIIVVARDHDRERARELAQVAQIWTVGDEQVDLPALLQRLSEAGLSRLLCEGGPQLNGALLAEDLVDEIFVTVTPAVYGGEAPRIVRSGQELSDLDFALISVYEHDHELLLRYERVR